jgi:hypothetical protein
VSFTFCTGTFADSRGVPLVNPRVDCDVALTYHYSYYDQAPIGSVIVVLMRMLVEVRSWLGAKVRLLQ